MHLGLGIATNELDLAAVKSTQSVLLLHLAKSAKRFCALKNVKDFVYKWYPSLEVEVPVALLLHVTRCSIFSNSSIILPGLWASVGVTRSYSNRPFVCTLAGIRLQYRNM